MSKSSEIIKLVPNDGGLEVPVHKELLCFFSSYYNAALNGKFSEALKNRFDVALCSEHLKSFATWLYTGEIHNNEKNTIYWKGLLKLYVFADLVDSIALRRVVINEIVGFDELEPRYEHVKFILENVTRHSQLYEWTLASFIAHWKPQHDEDDPCLFDSETDPDCLLPTFMYNVMRGVADRKKDQGSSDRPCCNEPCEYHEHESKEEWEASMLIKSTW
jgi:hypothetical protein